MSTRPDKGKEPMIQGIVHTHFLMKTDKLYERNTIEELQRIADDLATTYDSEGLHFAEVDRELGFLNGEIYAIMKLLVIVRMKNKKN